MSQKITIGFVDDDKLFIEALSMLLNSHSFETLFLSHDGESLLRSLEEKGVPDILLSDLKLKGENGLELVDALRERYPGLKAIALSSFYKPVYVAAALRSGFCAFLPKNCEADELTDALQKVHETGIYFRAQDLAMIGDFLRDPSEKPDFEQGVSLTDKEKEIILLICRQMTTAEIAEKLFLSIRTVEGYRNRILDKLSIRNSAGLVVFAITHGILDVSELSLREHLR